MSTVFKDKDGKVIKTEPHTKYHPEGTGARDKDGQLIHLKERETAERSGTAETSPAKAATTAKKEAP